MTFDSFPLDFEITNNYFIFSFSNGNLQIKKKNYQKLEEQIREDQQEGPLLKLLSQQINYKKSDEAFFKRGSKQKNENEVRTHRTVNLTKWDRCFKRF